MSTNYYRAIKIDGNKRDYHRWIMEQELGRELRQDEVVHHIDGDKRNNDVSNLQVMTRSEHARLHSKPPYFPDWIRDANRERRIGVPPTNRKLSNEDVEYIRTNYTPRDAEFGCRALARKFGVCHQSILRVINNERYK